MGIYFERSIKEYRGSILEETLSNEKGYVGRGLGGTSKSALAANGKLLID
jgi:hypothetical protein